jgi:hypothetical protein
VIRQYASPPNSKLSHTCISMVKKRPSIFLPKQPQISGTMRPASKSPQRLTIFDSEPSGSANATRSSIPPPSSTPSDDEVLSLGVEPPTPTQPLESPHSGLLEPPPRLDSELDAPLLSPTSSTTSAGTQVRTREHEELPTAFLVPPPRPDSELEEPPLSPALLTTSDSRLVAVCVLTVKLSSGSR